MFVFVTKDAEEAIREKNVFFNVVQSAKSAGGLYEL